MNTELKHPKRLLNILVVFNFTLVCASAALQPVTVLQNGLSASASAGGDSIAPITTPDGRYVLFASTAGNLVPLPTNGPAPVVSPSALNVFVRDRTNGTTTLVSANLGGTGGADADALPVGISTNGRFALFESAADNLVANDTNGVSDIFVRDVLSNVTYLVSVATNGVPGNSTSQGSAITPDGRYVAFLSGASNLIAGDTNNYPDVFVRDLVTGQTVLASPGATAGSSPSFRGVPTETAPEISPDGRYVAFHSEATGLVAGVTTTNDIYVRDLVAATTVQVTADARALSQAKYGTTSIACDNFILSSDGQFVAYEVAPLSSWAGLILRHNLQTGVTDLISTNGAVTSIFDARSLDMTPDSTRVAFVANTNTPPGQDSCVVVWDSQTGLTTLASGGAGGSVAIGSVCDWPTLTPDGHFVTFISSATNLPGSTGAGSYHLYRTDLQSATTVLVDVETNSGGAVLSDMPIPAMSADGRFVAFETLDSSLVPLDGNRDYDVFERDLQSGATELISVRDPGLPDFAPDGMSELASSSIGANGRLVAFSSEGDNLVSNGTNGFRDVFARDLVAGTNVLVSVAPDGVTPGDNFSSGASMSGDGRLVVFTSSADNLVSNDTNKSQDVFVRDLVGGVTTLVSVNSNGNGPGNGDAYSVTISANGQYVMFTSVAKNLAPGFFVNSNLFVRNLQSATTYALTTNGFWGAAMTPSGRFVAFLAPYSNPILYVWDAQSASRIYTNATSGIQAAAISPDGHNVVYWTSAGLFAGDVGAGTNWMIAAVGLRSSPGLSFSADSRYLAYSGSAGLGTTYNTNYVYVYDFQTQSNSLVSLGMGAANAGDDSPVISPNGRFVAYRSAAPNNIPSEGQGVPVVLLFDRVANTTTLVSADAQGNSNNRSLSPSFSPDGGLLVFNSWASDLVANDFNQSSDLFAYALPTTGTLAPFSSTLLLQGDGYWLTWPVVPGRTYQIQYKSNISDPVWNEAPGGVVVVGNTGYYQESSPDATKRFYRIMAF